MGVRSLLLRGALLLQFLQHSFAVTIDGDCAEWHADVQQAVDSMVNMARYAVARARDSDSTHRQGTVLRDMTGASDENDAEALDYMRGVIAKAGATALSPATVIHCKDGYLTKIDGVAGVYRDSTTSNNIRVQAPRNGKETSDTACGRSNEAFSYPTLDGPRIVLCSDWAGSALKSYQSFMDLEKLHTGKIKGFSGMTSTKAQGIDILSLSLAYKVFHEMMHASDFGGFPAILPDKKDGQNVPELYKYEKITGSPIGTVPGIGAPSKENRRHNADGFALLGAAWYLQPYKFENGVLGVVSPKSYWPPEVYEYSGVDGFGKIKRRLRRRSN